MGLASVMYELTAECGKCHQPLPLNGAMESAHCAACQNVAKTPPEFWSDVLAEATGEALGFEEQEGRNSTMIMGKWGMTVKLKYGKLQARCEPDCKTSMPEERIRDTLAKGGGKLFCGACGKSMSVRQPPAWFKTVHPSVAGLVGEQHASDSAEGEDPAQIRFHCYACGAAAALDGKSRSINCTYCHTDLVIPDPIWVRLHPAPTVSRWFAMLDVGDGVSAVPEDCWTFCDLTVDANARMILAYHADDEGQVGHPCRIGALNENGMFDWLQDGVMFSDDAVLMVSPGDARIVLIDPEEGFVRYLDPTTGDPVGTVESPESSDSGESLNVRDARRLTVDWDGSIVVVKWWDGAGGRCMRRFHATGALLPLWPGMRIGKGEGGDAPDWRSLKDHPVMLPDDAHIGRGWDGHFYIVDDKLRHVAKYTRDGRLVGVLPTGIDYAAEIEAFDVARDGTMTVLFEHAHELGGSRWAHLLRISADGRVMPWLGPHFAESPLLGQYDDKLEVLPDGTAYVGHGLDSLRIIAPDGSLRFQTNATRRHEKDYLRGELEKARRGRKLVADRV